MYDDLKKAKKEITFENVEKEYASSTIIHVCKYSNNCQNKNILSKKVLANTFSGNFRTLFVHFAVDISEQQLIQLANNFNNIKNAKRNENEIKETLEDYGYHVQEVKRLHKMPIVKVMLSNSNDVVKILTFRLDKNKSSLKSHFKQCRKCYRLNHHDYGLHIINTLPFDCKFMKENAISSIDITLCLRAAKQLRRKLQLEKYQHMVNSINALHEGNTKNLFTQFKALNTNKICIIPALVNKETNSVARADTDKACLLAKHFQNPLNIQKMWMKSIMKLSRYKVAISKPLELADDFIGLSDITKKKSLSY
ncbi:hypothetical protein RFI_35642 [Reticulomyxa filosa]|uniref:Uncharacterized protein n=1 Tax=Reticulomyxa filosa TaxID=46433 RepID=X6LKA4_RETFI|nr:hypothetical protein RFI_35642 [Reticulomyxa filosa]|eukprot:ETO01796.1 hypothetical protein RFI_35642 [Reticulomyxa filosa]